jgi:2-polyprenyl-3-methyl-5-hydroxy-6-metoxy-1,4-benzoquinol methylase
MPMDMDLKPDGYFTGERSDIVRQLETGPESLILELGCGAGGTGRAALAAGKAGRYVGIEINEAAAAGAREYLSDVLVGDVHALDLTDLEGRFDALIISEVLEHLVDPWGTLARLSACLKPGAKLYVSSPNVSHWHVIRMLVRGGFHYEDSGVMDRTHLRWFTPLTYGQMVEGAGFELLSVGSVSPMATKGKLIGALTGGRFNHLFITQIMIVARKTAASGK